LRAEFWRLPAHQNASLIADSDGHRRELLPGLSNVLVKVEGDEMVVRGFEHVRQLPGEPVAAWSWGPDT